MLEIILIDMNNRKNEIRRISMELPTKLEKDEDKTEKSNISVLIAEAEFIVSPL